MLTRLFLTTLMSLAAAVSQAQESAFNRLQGLGRDSVEVGAVMLDVDALTFFRDNEYDSDLATGYTLPGAWVRPAIKYDPLENIHLELGLSALFFSGANKYPCYAYHDIAQWKGSQYQEGCHLLPWIRADFRSRRFHFVMGDIYGGANHQFATPLYNNEQLLSADPEMGFQILYDDAAFHGDAYVNWQSFQFKEDTHQEAFTAGLSTRLAPFRGGGLAPLAFTLAAIVQHRGGEMDVPSHGAQTVCNASAGILWEKNLSGAVSSLVARGDVLLCRQQLGHLWHFDNGLAYNAEVTADFRRGFRAQMGYFGAPGHFVSLYGSPFFSTVSTKHENLKFSGISTAYLKFGYAKTFARAYTIGAHVEAFSVSPAQASREFNFAAALCMRINPSFLLGRH